MDSSSAMTLIMYILRSIGADPGFQVRGAEGGTNIFGVFRVKNPKNHIFSNFRGGGHMPGAPPLDPPLGHQFRNLLTLIIKNWSKFVLKK